jgi:hypothetical protein
MGMIREKEGREKGGLTCCGLGRLRGLFDFDFDFDFDFGYGYGF